MYNTTSTFSHTTVYILYTTMPPCTMLLYAVVLPVRLQVTQGVGREGFTVAGEKLRTGRFGPTFLDFRQKFCAFLKGNRGK